MKSRYVDRTKWVPYKLINEENEAIMPNIGASHWGRIAVEVTDLFENLLDLDRFHKQREKVSK